MSRNNFRVEVEFIEFPREREGSTSPPGLFVLMSWQVSHLLWFILKHIYTKKKSDSSKSLIKKCKYIDPLETESIITTFQDTSHLSHLYITFQASDRICQGILTLFLFSQTYSQLNFDCALAPHMNVKRCCGGHCFSGCREYCTQRTIEFHPVEYRDPQFVLYCQ